MGFLDLAADLAAVAGASRSIASKHAALRTRQLGAAYAAAADKPAKAALPPAASAEVTETESASSVADPTPSVESPAAAVSETRRQEPQEPQQPREPQQPQLPPTQRTREPQNDAPAVDEPVMPTFIHRAQLRAARPPGVLQTLRKPMAADMPPSGGPPRPHPLDPRFRKVPEPPIVGADETARPSPIAAAVGKNVFSTTRAPETRPATAEADLPAAPSTPASEASAGASAGASVVPEPQPVAQPIAERVVQEHDQAPVATAEAEAKTAAPAPKRAVKLKESKVPATRLSRMWNYGGLAAGMLGGAVTETISRSFGGGSADGGSVMLSAGNLERLVSRLSRMRGAALKMGQMMSFQDAKMLPTALQEVLQRVQDGADYMPARQRDRVLVSNLGAGWRDLFSEFDETPLAAASIGQVHRATLRSNGAPVAVKIQFPGVADSINSDLDNLAILLTATRMLPRGLYLDKTIANARTELAWECDYEREAACARRFQTLLADAGETGPHGAFVVPEVYDEASGKHVLTMAFMDGVAVTRMVPDLTQAQRDWIGTEILRLCLLEITQFHFMQTDPNWTNFLYNAATSKLELLDFGASREYPAAFVDQYVRLLRAAARGDLTGVQDLSRQLGYLTGHESRAMLDAHTQSVLTLAEPFCASSPDLYDFHDQTITDRVRSFIPVMVRERLTPPPEETYSLHRKLSGAFLLCARLGSRVRCRSLFDDSLRKMGLEA